MVWRNSHCPRRYVYFWIHFNSTGDFRQCLPVTPNASRQAIINTTLINTPFWHNVHTLPLTINLRATRNALSPDSSAKAHRWASWLLAVGEGRIHTTSSKDIIDLPLELCLPPGCPQQDLIHRVYPDIANATTTDICSLQQYFSERAILAPRNNNVDAFNDAILSTFPGDEKDYFSADSYVTDDPTSTVSLQLPLALLNSTVINGFPLHKLALKVGCPVLLLRNL